LIKWIDQSSFDQLSFDQVFLYKVSFDKLSFDQLSFGRSEKKSYEQWEEFDNKSIKDAQSFANCHQQENTSKA
jgi:hypothetical protein